MRRRHDPNYDTLEEYHMDRIPDAKPKAKKNDPDRLHMPSYYGKSNARRKVSMNLRLSIELNNKLVKSAIARRVSLTTEINERLESTFK